MWDQKIIKKDVQEGKPVNVVFKSDKEITKVVPSCGCTSYQISHIDNNWILEATVNPGKVLYNSNKNKIVQITAYTKESVETLQVDLRVWKDEFWKSKQTVQS